MPLRFSRLSRSPCTPRVFAQTGRQLRRCKDSPLPPVTGGNSRRMVGRRNSVSPPCETTHRSVYPFHLPLFTPDCGSVCQGDSGSPHEQKARAQARELELLHLPREVSLPFMSRLKFGSRAIHSVNDKRSRDNLATPDTNRAVTVRDTSS